MRKLYTRKRKPVGAVPGTLVYTGEKHNGRAKITLIDYDEKQYQKKEVQSIEACLPFKGKPTVTWINIDGLFDVELIEKTGELFSFHSLLLEDILNTSQRPKYEDFGDFIYIVLRMLEYVEQDNEVISEQVSVILGNNFVISFQEKEGDVFEPIRKRIVNNKGRVRKMHADYLAYSLIDTVVDNYFVILEKLGEQIESLEEKLVTSPNPDMLQIIHHLKREMILLRKSVWPLREMVSSWQRNESPLINKSTTVYLNDVYDHTIQVIDTVETFRDMVSGMLDIYLSSVSNRMNEVMKVLTIIATIFIPLTFIAGIYGMNFEYMPELKWRFGYFTVWGLILVIFVSMLVYFKRKKWL